MIPKSLLNPFQEVFEALSEESEAVSVLEDVDYREQVVALALRQADRLEEVADAKALEDVLDALDAEVEVRDEFVGLDVFVDGLQLAEVFEDVGFLLKLDLIGVLELRLDQVLLLQEDYQVLDLDDVRKFLAWRLDAGDGFGIVSFFDTCVWNH